MGIHRDSAMQWSALLVAIWCVLALSWQSSDADHGDLVVSLLDDTSDDVTDLLEEEAGGYKAGIEQKSDAAQGKDAKKKEDTMQKKAQKKVDKAGKVGPDAATKKELSNPNMDWSAMFNKMSAKQRGLNAAALNGGTPEQLRLKLELHNALNKAEKLEEKAKNATNLVKLKVGVEKAAAAVVAKAKERVAAVKKAYTKARAKAAAAKAKLAGKKMGVVVVE